MKKYLVDFIKEMPKSDLHLHLDGSMRIPTLIQMAKKNNINLPSYTEEGLRELVFKNTYNNLGEYLQGFQYTCEVMRDLEHIEQISYELAWDNINENVYYIEPRFAPQLLMDERNGLTFEEVLKAVYKGLEKAKIEFNNSVDVKNNLRPEFHYGIISCAMRNFGPDNYSPYYTQLYQALSYSKKMDILKAGAMQMVRAAVKIRDELAVPIVGIDLAGQEDGYPPGKFKEIYSFAHQHFMHKTVHAGEAYGAESIFQAITECHADRIGHGYYLFNEEKILDTSIEDKKRYLDNLISFVADKRTTIEVCLTSNLQTNPNIKSVKDHNVKHMLENRMSLTICTDNRLVSNTTVTNEYSLLLNNFEISPKHLKDIVAYGFKKSFYFGEYIEKRNWAKSMMKNFDTVASKYNIKL